MGELERLLDTEPVVVTAGVDVLADALEAQTVAVHRTEWSPPAAGTESALARLAATQLTVVANRIAAKRLLDVRPHLVDVVSAREVIPALNERTFLHAGPPVSWVDATGPLRGALMGAMLYEGLATTPEDAAAKLAAADVELSPCHHHQAVGPMAGCHHSVHAGPGGARSRERRRCLFDAQRGAWQGASLRRLRPGSDRTTSMDGTSPGTGGGGCPPTERPGRSAFDDRSGAANG